MWYGKAKNKNRGKGGNDRVRTKYVKKKINVTTATIVIIDDLGDGVYAEVDRQEISIPGKLSEETLKRIVSKRIDSPFKVVSFVSAAKYYQCPLDKFMEIAQERGPLRTVKPKTTD